MPRGSKVPTYRKSKIQYLESQFHWFGAYTHIWAIEPLGHLKPFDQHLKVLEYCRGLVNYQDVGPIFRTYNWNTI